MNKLLQSAVEYMKEMNWVIGSKHFGTYQNNAVTGIALTQNHNVLLLSPMRNSKGNIMYGIFDYGSISTYPAYDFLGTRVMAESLTDVVSKYNELWEENMIVEVVNHSGDDILFNEDGEYVLVSDVE